MCRLHGPTAHLARSSLALCSVVVASQQNPARHGPLRAVRSSYPNTGRCYCIGLPICILWGGLCGGGSPKDDAHFFCYRALGFYRVGPSFFSRTWFFLALRPLTLLLHRRGPCHPMLVLTRWPLVGPVRWPVKCTTSSSLMRSSGSRLYGIWGHVPHVARPQETIVIYASLLVDHSRCLLAWSCLGLPCAAHVRMNSIAMCALVWCFPASPGLPLCRSSPLPRYPQHPLPSYSVHVC